MRPLFYPIWLFAAVASCVCAQTPRPQFNGIGIQQNLNAAIPLDLVFHDETGAALPLRTYFGQKPVLLVPMYFRCAMLCSQVLRGVVAGLRPLSIKPGRDFEVVAVSFDPADTPAEAAQKREQYSHSYSSKLGTAGWHFLTGDEQTIRPLMDAIGFHYRYDPQHQMFVHASGVMVLTPDGHLARYLYGVEYEPKDLKLSLIEASHDRIGSPVDQILLFCYHYDPRTGKYGAMVIDVLRGAAILMIGLLGVGGWLLFRRDLQEHRA
jgi:protein SCO1/2